MKNKINLKEYMRSVSIKNSQIKPEMRIILKDIKQRQSEQMECLQHEGDAILFSDKRVRRYRRGEMRCKRCGWFVEVRK